MQFYSSSLCVPKRMLAIKLLCMVFGLNTMALTSTVDFRVFPGYFTRFRTPESFNVSSGFECVFRCQLLTEYICSFAQYKQAEGSCQLYNWRDIRRFKLRDNTLESSSWVYVATDSKHVYLENHAYNYNYTTALQKCELIGATLASTSDLMRAHSQGYWQCVCGYTSEAQPYYYAINALFLCEIGLHQCQWDKIGAHCTF